MEDGNLTVKEAAALTGLSAHTLRYYEREGLLGPIARAGSGHRRYSGQDVALIEFLGRLRATGMSIRGMKRFADLRRGGDATIRERRALLEGHRGEVRRRVAELEGHLRTIDEKVKFCEETEARDAALAFRG